MAKKPLTFTHNGDEKAVFVDEGQNLLDVLRRGLGDLTPKYGCGQGTCGACTVIVDGSPRLSCLTLAQSVDGQAIETVAGLAEGGRLSPLQNAFMEHFAAQCGYCTDGMLMSAAALLRANPRPSREEVVEAISGNLCRCTGYEAIINAVLAAAGGGARHTG
ncbi:MAG: (2Fe-2S)-binding protein [Devosia sp.]